MAASIQDHIHLDTDNPPTTEYDVMQGSWDHTPDVGLVVERGVTGYAHVHRLVDGGGDPIQFQNERFTLLGLTLAQMLTIRALIGKTVYFNSNYHDPAAHAATVVTGVLIIEPGGIQNIDPSATVWNIQCKVEDTGAVP